MEEIRGRCKKQNKHLLPLNCKPYDLKAIKGTRERTFILRDRGFIQYAHAKKQIIKTRIQVVND